MGFHEGRYYIIDCRLDHATNAEFVEWIYELNKSIPEGIQVYNFIENNTLQNPFFEQVIVPLFNEKAKTCGHINLTPDTRKKPDKFARIEGNLEPLNRNGRLIFNEAQSGNPHMKRLEEEFLLLEPGLSAPADGADSVEGCVFKINEKLSTLNPDAFLMGRRPVNRKRV